MERRVHQDAEVLPVLVEELELKGVGKLIGCDPGLGLGLEPTNDKTTDLFFEVGVSIRVTKDRKLSMDAIDLLGHHIEVLGGVQRHGHARHGPNRLGPLAGAVDHDLRLDRSSVGLDARHPTLHHRDTGDPCLLKDEHSRISCPSGQ